MRFHHCWHFTSDEKQQHCFGFSVRLMHFGDNPWGDSEEMFFISVTVRGVLSPHKDAFHLLTDHKG